MIRGAISRWAILAGLATPASARGAQETQGITVEELAGYQGQASLRIVALAATYVYHKQGAGFASLVDPDGRDWISYRSQGGSDGQYRGIPNLIHPEGGFHPGSTKRNPLHPRPLLPGPGGLPKGRDPGPDSTSHHPEVPMSGSCVLGQ